MPRGIITECLKPYMDRIEPYLGKLGRGDVVDEEKIELLTKQPAKRLEARIKRYFGSQGMLVFRCNGVLHIATDDEQANNASKRTRGAKRQVVKAIVELSTVDRDKLSSAASALMPDLLIEMERVRDVAGTAAKNLARSLGMITKPTKRMSAGY